MCEYAYKMTIWSFRCQINIFRIDRLKKTFYLQNIDFSLLRNYQTYMKHKSQTAPLVIIEPESQHITFVQTELPQ